jgi:hypothetical protein
MTQDEVAAEFNDLYGTHAHLLVNFVDYEAMNRTERVALRAQADTLPADGAVVAMEPPPHQHRTKQLITIYRWSTNRRSAALILSGDPTVACPRPGPRWRP